MQNPQVSGREDAPILVVAQSPGREEMSQRMPLVGQAGRLFWQFAAFGGIVRQQCYIVNVVGELAAGKLDKVTPAQIKKYYPVFRDAVALSQARVAIVLGGVALKAFSGLEGGIDAWRGYCVRPDETLGKTVELVQQEERVRKSNAKCKCAQLIWVDTLDWRGKPRKIKTYNGAVGCEVCGGSGWRHRAGDMRTVNVRARVLVAAAQLGQLEWIMPVVHPAAVMRSGYTLLPFLKADLMRAGRAITGTLRIKQHTYDVAPTIFAGSDPVALDLETSATGDIVRVGMADEYRTWSAPATDTVLNIVRQLVSGRELIVHNAGFDVKLLEANGVSVSGPVFDTMIAAHVLQPDAKKALNSVASMLLDVERWKHKEELDPIKYNALDVRHTYDLREALVGGLERTGQTQLFREVLMPGLRTLIRMSANGMCVDQVKVQELKREARARYDSALEQWQANWPGVNPNSPLQVAKHFNIASTDVEVLAQLAQNSPHAPAAALLLTIRKNSKIIETYLSAYERSTVHPSYLPVSKDFDGQKGMAGTGRITSSDPNAQNIPAELRGVFVPHVRGNVFIEADWNQIEARIIAAEASDQALMRALDGDIHSVNMNVLGCDRVRAKNVFYGTAYGAGARKLAMLLNAKGVRTTIAECAALQQKLARAYPRMWAWRDAVAREAEQKHYLTNAFGRRRYFYRGSADAPRAIDYRPQSNAADIMWTVLPQVESAVGTPITCVHDSLLLECAPNDVRGVVGVVVNIMEQSWDAIAPGFKVPVAIKVGRDWGNMKPLSEWVGSPWANYTLGDRLEV